MAGVIDDLQTATLITYIGPESQWDPAYALRDDQTQQIVRMSDQMTPRVFTSARDAVIWARECGYRWVTAAHLMAWKG